MRKRLLADLDSLAQTVREPSSRVYIQEAITAYRSGAFRAAIVATWVAVIYDIIQKLRELAEHGEADARALLNRWDNAVSSGAKPTLLALEDSLLGSAHRDFQFLSSTEFRDLSRLREDRHLCAHPAFEPSGTLFSPEPDLVRTHMVHAIGHLMSRSPIQGKTALQRLKATS